MKKTLSLLIWLLVVLIGAGAYAVIATHRSEPVNSGFILAAALCTYAIGYRFYAKWIATKILLIDERRATPCEVHDDGKDFVRTNKWIVFGHHFAAISGPGPLVGPVLAAQFGYLPGTLWILIGVVLGGAVQDFVILFSSMRRDGKSLAQMVRDELTPAAGVIGVIAILAIMIILLAVLALVVVNALAESPWGVFTVAATVPIALLMGGYLRWVRIGKVLEGSILGVTLLLLAVWGGQYIHASATLAPFFTVKAAPLAYTILLYALAASVLPVWLLLAPRDYLSTFLKLGTIFALALGVFLVLPDLKMPPLTVFTDGTGPVVPGGVFPFCFITIACGAISGFHTLIASGITPKIITRESYARPIGYGAMCLESLVAIMAMIAACTLDPGVYLSMNIKVPGADAAAIAANTVAQVTAYGPTFHVTAAQMTTLADTVREHTLFGRTGGAATLAVGMANIFARVFGGSLLGVWYHFALMFEALFILTTLDAGTRVGRYLLQDALGHLSPRLADTRSLWANLFSSALIVAAWGYFLIAAVHDPDGGIKALWPIFGIANQLLAAVALCLATTILIKIALKDPERPRPRIILVTLLPLCWLLTVTLTAGVQKIAHSSPKIGFLAAAAAIQAKIPSLELTAASARLTTDPAGPAAILAAILAADKALKTARAQLFNNRLDAAVTATFLLLVLALVAISIREWLLLLTRQKPARLHETAPVWLPPGALEAEPSAIGALGAIGLSLALLKEITGESAIDRAQALASCEHLATPRGRQNTYLTATAHRYTGITRCC